MTASGVSAQFMMAEEVYTNEVQQISGTPSGAFSLIFDGAQTTVSGLATNASAAQVQAALEALPNIGTGNVACAGGALPAAITITFSGATVSKRNVPALTVQTGITGLTVATNTPGTGYGDPVTVTRGLEVLNEGLELSIDRIESNAIRANNRAQRTDRWAAGRRQAGGPVEFELWSKGQSMLWGQCLGIDPVITTPSGATNTRDHTFNVTNNDNFNRSFVAQKGVPDVNGVVNPYTYVGGKIVEWELSMENDGLGTLKVTTDFQDERQNIALAVVNYPTTVELLYFTGGQITIGGANVDLTKITLNGKMTYKDDRFMLRASTTAGGASLKKEPIANGPIEITGTVEGELESLALYNRYVNGTLAPLVITFQGSIIEAGGGATVNPRYGLTITLPNTRFDGDTAKVNDMDVVGQELPIKALYDGSSNLMTAVYRTTDTTK